MLIYHAAHSYNESAPSTPLRTNKFYHYDQNLSTIFYVFFCIQLALVVTVQTGLCIYCTGRMKEQILSPMGQGTHPARREAILIGWIHVTVRVSELLQLTY